MVLATIEGEIESKGSQGRHQIEWLHNIKTGEGGLQQAHQNSRERRPTAH